MQEDLANPSAQALSLLWDNDQRVSPGGLTSGPSNNTVHPESRDTVLTLAWTNPRPCIQELLLVGLGGPSAVPCSDPPQENTEDGGWVQPQFPLYPQLG